MALSLLSVLKTSDPNFLKEYAGQILRWSDAGPDQNQTYLVTPQGLQPQGLYKGGDALDVNPYSGLAPSGQSSYNRQEGYRYFNLDNPELRQAIKTGLPSTWQEILGGANPEQPTEFQKYFTARKAAGATPEQILSDPKNPYNLGGQQLPPASVVIAAPTDYSSDIKSIYSQNFGRNPTQIELDDQNRAIREGRLTLNTIKNWAVSNPKNISKTGQVSQPDVSSGNAIIDEKTEIAKKAGAAGIALDDYLKILTNQAELTPEENDTIRKNLGIDTLETSVFTKPSKTTEQLYQDAFTAAGLTNIKTKMTELENSINQKRSDLVKRVGAINNNPWMTESSRLRSVRDTISLAQEDIGNVVGQLGQYKELYNTGLNEVNNFVSRNVKDYEMGRELDTNKLNYLVKKAEGTAAATKAGKLEKLYRYVPEFLKAKVGATAPKTIGSAETGFYRWNADKQTFEQVIAPKPAKAEKATEGEVKTFLKQSMAGELKKVVGRDGYISPENWRIARKKWADSTPYSGKEFDDNFRGYINPANPQDYAGFENYATNFKKAPNLDY